MNKYDELTLNLIRDAIDGESQTGDEHKDKVKQIQKSLFDEGGLEKSLQSFITKLRPLGPIYEVPLNAIEDWFKAESFESDGGFLAKGILDLMEFGNEELETFYDRFLYHHEENGLDVDAMIKVFRQWFRSGGHKEFFAEISSLAK